MSLQITFLGHAAFLFNDGTHTLAIDPFLTGNPVATMTPEDLTAKFIALTHGHGDHLGDTETIAQRNQACVIGVHEIDVLVQSWGHPGVTSIGTNHGGRVKLPFGWIAFTDALHSSSHPDGRYLGNPCGLVINMGGTVVYHAGDTDIFGDMKLIGELYQPRVALLPIGDRYTMGPQHAALAAQWLGCEVAVPMHYKTFPILVQSAEEFQPKGVEVKEMAPGETWLVN